MNRNLPEIYQSGCTEVVVQRGNSVLIVAAAAVASIMASTRMARADAELKILVGSTVVYNSGILVGTSAVNDSYSYTSGATSFSLLYGWNNEGGVGEALGLGNIVLNSSVPVTFELSDNDNPTSTGGVYLYVLGEGTMFGAASWYSSSGNALLAQSTQLDTIPFSTGGQFGSFSSNPPHALGVLGPYSLTEVLTVTGTVTGPDNLLSEMNLVPDGGMTLPMLGFGFCGLLAVRNGLTA